MPYPPPPRHRVGRAPFVAGLVGVVVLAVALVVGAVLLVAGTDGGADDARAPGPGTERPEDDRGPWADPWSHDGPDAPDATGPDGHPRPDDPGAEAPPAPDGRDPRATPAPDGGALPATGLRLPLLAGWQRAPGADGALVSAAPYRCPTGGAVTRPDAGTATGDTGCARAAALLVDPGSAAAGRAPREVAAADVRAHAARAARAGGGTMTGHSVRAAGPVPVAGGVGHRLRWRIERRSAPDRYVESTAFHHPDGSGRVLVLRAELDVHPDAPPPRDLDRLRGGVHAVPPPRDGPPARVRHGA
ncbi:hypothetical protein [Streptomyces sp. AJS327]|uniref:hypothetical protein n=1 Tax=Streptomyces sp. AJS327 TaxID=2545265 RepID=UPI0021559678|nr:hypothetical protein [Streptomyces sp. AJS327]